MKILCVSDSHGDLAALEEIVGENPDARLLLHLGDGNRELEELRCRFPKLEYAAVRGNCDRVSDFPTLRMEIIRGVPIFLTHGHLFSVKRSLEEIWLEGCRREAALVLFGHTHRPHLEERAGMWLLNPGSASRYDGAGSYATITLADRRVKDCRLHSLSHPPKASV